VLKLHLTSSQLQPRPRKAVKLWRGHEPFQQHPQLCLASVTSTSPKLPQLPSPLMPLVISADAHITKLHGMLFNKKKAAAQQSEHSTDSQVSKHAIKGTSSEQVSSSSGKQKAQEQDPAKQDPLRCAKLLFAGAMSAVVSRTCVAPLERVKMEMMLKQNAGSAVATASQVLNTEGLLGFWKGNALNVLRTAPFKAVNFFSFDMYHQLLVRMMQEEGNVQRFTAGACAGVTATVVCFPLDVLRTRMMAKGGGPRYGGPISTLAGIVRNEGPQALYTGCLPAVIGMAPAGSVFYGVFDLLKHRHLNWAAQQREQQQQGASVRSGQHALQPAPQHLEPMYTLLYGAIAGMASEVIVYPLEVVRRRMQLQCMSLAAARASVHRGAAAAAAASTTAATAAAVTAAAGTSGWARVVSTVVAVAKAEGFKGFYAGMGPNVLQVLPSAALSYYTYDTMKQVLGI